KAATIRQPIEEQYRDAEREMKQLLFQREAEKNRLRIFRFLALVVASMGAGAVAALMFNIKNSTFGFAHEFSPLITDAVTLIVSAVVAVSGYSVFKGKIDSVSSEITQLRLDRQMTLLTERLRKLELLRTLDPESLVRRR